MVARRIVDLGAVLAVAEQRSDGVVAVLAPFARPASDPSVKNVPHEE